MKGVTVSELSLACGRLIEKGLGDKEILISQDDEGNGYHTLWWTFNTDIDEIKDYKKFSGFHDDNNPEDVVLLG